MKKLFSLFLALLASICILWASDTQVNGIWYIFDHNALTATVTYKGDRSDWNTNRYSGSVIIPSTVTYSGRTYIVNSIGKYAFENCSTLSSITIPSSVKSIGSGAFRHCENLISISIPEGVTTLEGGCFQSCKNLKSVTIASTVTTIGDYAFNWCENLLSINIPEGIAIINKNAFLSCGKLKSISLPKSLKVINESAFGGCHDLSSVEIPSSVTSIGQDAFAKVPHISYNGTASGSPWGARAMNGYIEGSLVYADNSRMRLMACLPNATGHIRILDGVKEIEKSAFLCCENITSVTIPNSVTKIGSSAFFGCNNLASVTLPNNITIIEAYTFSRCYSLNEIHIPNSVTYIGEWAFASCKGLTSIVIPENVKRIGEYAFDFCENLQSITLPDGIEILEEWCFDYCKSLSSITIPKNVKKIGKHVFANCEKLTTVVWNVENYPNPFNDSPAPFQLSRVNSFVFGENVKSIPSYLCYFMHRLKSITIPNGVTSIGQNVFGKCDSLETIYWNVENYPTPINPGSSPWGYPKSCSIIFGENVRTIPANLCSNMRLTSVTIPESVTKVGYNAFNNAFDYQQAEIHYPNGFLYLSNAGIPSHVKRIPYVRKKPIYFSDYAKPMVEKAINEWQKKDEFESVAAWQKRVNEVTRNAKIKELTNQYEKEYLDKCISTLKLNISLEQYDAENEVFLLTDPIFGNMLVPVPADKGRAFKENWASAKLTPKFFIENDVPSISSLDIFIPALKKHFVYSNQASLKYEQAFVDYDFDPIEIAKSGSSVSKGQQTISEKKIAVGKSEVDMKIPETGAKNENTFVLIFANEDYKNVATVPFALNDGRIFAKYCQRTLGVPAANIKVYENSTYNDMRLALAWLKNVCEKYEGEASVIVYYAGHGIPDASDKSAYLLPVDGDGRYVATGYKLDDLYQKLGEMPTKTTMVLLDACFSGANRDGKMLASERGVALKSKPSQPQGNMVVFSAAQGDETALPNEEEGHGMFTYFLLKKLQETKGDITLSDLSQYVIREVGKKSAVSNKPQTPSIVAATDVANVWQSWKLK